MFARAAEVNPADRHKLVRLVLKFGLEMSSSIVGQAGKCVAVRSRDTAGCFPQTIPIRVLADREQNLADRSFNALQVHGRLGNELVTGRSFDHVLAHGKTR